MPTGLTEFKRMLREFRGLSLWAVGAGTAVPFAAALVDVSPPWPSGIVVITAIVELVALVLVFSIFRSASKRRNNRALVIGAAALACSGIFYLGALSLFTYETPVTNDRYTKGYECTEQALLVFGKQCPWLGRDQLSTAEYQADRLWTTQSITAIRIALVALWFAVFASLAGVLGTFLVYQMRARKPVRASSGG